MKGHAMKRILVVDDSATMRMLISFSLRKIVRGVDVTEAGNGLEALSKLEGEDFDLMLTDLMMPEMDGLQLIGRIRSLRKTLPIVVITTKGEERERDAGLSQGADSYITKPVDPGELRETVLRYLR
jgi:two-component system chemotaxis response regulator CheY